MQILSREFTEAWNYRIINIHHGFLPAFKGAKPYHQAWAKGVKIIGATAHFATADLDQGPIIWQSVQQVADTGSIKNFIQIGKDVEKRTLLHALKLYLERRVFLHEERTFVL
jgi:formyltetrahydrofolate deformylase